MRRHPFGLELAMLARGDHVRTVLQSACGQDSAGRAWVSLFLSQLELVGEHSQRQIVEHWLRTFSRVKRHGGGWRVCDSSAFVGRKHELVDATEDVEIIDEQTGEFETVTTPTGRRKLAHCPAARAGGLAARSKRSPRQLDRYRGALRRAGLMGSKQPRSTAKDAVLPKAKREDGRSWAYAHHWLPYPPSAEMMRRWGFKAPAQRPELGSRELPRLPSEPEALRAVLSSVKAGDVPY